MTKILTLLFVLLGFGAASRAQSIFVGNAGEGVLDGKQIYLRDLFEVRRHLEPVIGDAVDPEIVRRLNERFSQDPDGPMRTLALDKKLLARKLSDLNLRHPNLGFYVLDAFSFHRWGRTGPKEGRVQIVDGHVIVARRSFGLVTVEGWAWDRLSPEHRIAFLVHEMLGSFQKLDCVPDGDKDPLCEKDDEALRRLVGRLFSPASETSAFIRSELEATLAIPTDVTPLFPRGVEETFLQIERLCGKTPHRFTLEMKRAPYLIRKEKYRRHYRNVLYYRDVTFRFESVEASRLVPVTPASFRDDPKDCERSLSQIFMNWLAEGLTKP